MSVNHLMTFSNVRRNERMTSCVDDLSVAFDADARMKTEILA